ncbi:HNH endonuclease [Chitinophaga caseinilytica]|uniref:HNH endonuclease n=1 Tax=Chitinophaga caseinilytica TaxID=2267521 RepID=UPI003C2AE5DB
MNWKRIPKEVSIPPTTGVYSDWKPQLSVEGFHHCVYCTISEANFGGIRNFHVEHLRPKGDSRFRGLENDYSNLFYACAICNTFKSDDWPNDPIESFNIAFYPDPSKVDYSDLFELTGAGEVLGKNFTATYLVSKIYLNRPQLVLDRKIRILENIYSEVMSQIRMQKQFLFDSVASGNLDALELLRELDSKIQELEKIFHGRDTTIPYVDDQTRRK